MPDSIAGLSKSGVNAKHTGKTCSHLELVVRECGLMLQGMVSVFLMLSYFNVFCRIRFAPQAPGAGERKQEVCIQGFFISFCQYCIPAGIFAIYMADRKMESFHRKSSALSLHTFILHKHPFFTTSLKNFALKICTVLLSCHFERSEAESRNLLPPCSPPLHWPHSIERNAGSSFWKELGGALRNTEINFQKFFLPGGLKIEPSAILISEG